jgi:hypothetical protein
MAVGRTKKKSGRRRNYEPTVELTGIHRFLPVGWGNWGGFLLFGFLSIALFVDFLFSLGRPQYNDWIAAIIMCAAFVWITVLFAITRWKDYV